MRNDEVPRVKFVPRLKGKIVGVARSLSRGTRGGIAADAMELADNLAALVNEDWDDDVTYVGGRVLGGNGVVVVAWGVVKRVGGVSSGLGFGVVNLVSLP